jgi:hypothetical protein
MMAGENPKDDRRYIIECIYRGRYAKVSAVDPVTATEVSIVGDSMRSKKRTRAGRGPEARIRDGQEARTPGQGRGEGITQPNSNCGRRANLR